MMVVFYDPDTGVIQNSAQGSPAVILADGRPYVEVAEPRDDYDVTHRVVDGLLVPIA